MINFNPWGTNTILTHKIFRIVMRVCSKGVKPNRRYIMLGSLNMLIALKGTILRLHTQYYSVLMLQAPISLHSHCTKVRICKLPGQWVGGLGLCMGLVLQVGCMISTLRHGSVRDLCHLLGVPLASRGS